MRFGVYREKCKNKHSLCYGCIGHVLILMFCLIPINIISGLAVVHHQL